MMTNLPQHFTIHGLWPTNFSLPWPENCAQIEKKHHFDQTLMTSTLQRYLEHYWPSLKPRVSNMKFWTQQWEKHGSCSAERFDQSKYFGKAVFITHRLDILAELKNAGIIPDGTKTYSRTDIVNAIKNTKTNQVEPELLCVQHQNDVLLSEIRLCLDANLAGPIPCPIDRSPDVTLCKTMSNLIIIPV
ncbi:ribonuclease 3-like isoform X2 [Arachis ipaensis]|nr:ribonuclease 3-like isoform X2 [Arachis ipaensis]XP_020958833.1 ribonuclease 3-like isoform X2 [Arachis ipaensis]XP_025656637.1 ribonuclease 3 isoform X2 [Arachis hypogaea]XP_025656638.1 ribonuclease 3 isoform X2 [Arachis hypogaea]